MRTYRIEYRGDDVETGERGEVLTATIEAFDREGAVEVLCEDVAWTVVSVRRVS